MAADSLGGPVRGRCMSGHTCPWALFGWTGDGTSLGADWLDQPVGGR